MTGLPCARATSTCAGITPPRTRPSYTNVVAYDHSRVKITPSEFNHNNDYINANFVPSHDNMHKPYIATQGPVPDSICE